MPADVLATDVAKPSAAMELVVQGRRFLSFLNWNFLIHLGMRNINAYFWKIFSYSFENNSAHAELNKRHMTSAGANLYHGLWYLNIGHKTRIKS